MAHKWIETHYTGIRYREHPTRKHGRVRYDRYYNVRFQVGGQQVNEGYGWESEGMTLEKVALLKAEMRNELLKGKGTGRLADRRKQQAEEQLAAKAAEEEQARLQLTYEEFWDEHYSPLLADKKPSTSRREEELHRLWILPAIGSRPIRELTELDIARVTRSMAESGRADRTQHYAQQSIRMVINHAIRHNYFKGTNPVTLTKKPKYDNTRDRFLSKAEAKQLLDALAKKSKAIHDMALLSLYTGLRLGEIYSLTWTDIDLAHRQITVRDTKSGRTRVAGMTKQVKAMLETVPKHEGCQYVFPARIVRAATNGKTSNKPSYKKRAGNISKTFPRVVDALGYNDGADDSRQKVTFHTLRHTYASWLVMEGVPLYTVQKMLGHSDLKMTMRYSHHAPEHFAAATNVLENIADQIGSEDQGSRLRTVGGSK